METWWQNAIGVILTAVITWLATRRKNNAEASELEKQVEQRAFEIHEEQLKGYQSELENMRKRVNDYINDANEERTRYSARIKELEDKIENLANANVELKKQINRLTSK
jgi:peptidoglycan hydrolase CwlO-like protein